MSQIQKNNELPVVEVSNKGEMQLNGDKISYASWSTAQLPGKVRTVQHLAGRSSAKELNEALISALKAAEFPHETYQTTTIVNVNDAVFGTSSIVTMMAEGGKKEFPHSSVVIDAKGTVLKAWGLQKESSAIAVLDEAGKVLFFKEGKLSGDEINEVIQLIESSLTPEMA
jgi:YtfJ family uncharacterized protein